MRKLLPEVSIIIWTGKNPPAFGFSPDAEFPVIHAEKGTIRYLYHLPPADQDILSIHAGSRLNVVPDQAEARLAHISPEQVQALISIPEYQSYHYRQSRRF